MPKPTSIQRFDIFYLGSLAVYAVGFFLGFDDTVAQVRDQYAQAGLDMNPSGIMTGAFVVILAISVLLWWLISNKRSVAAKWILVVLFGLSLLSLVFGLQTLLANLSIATMLSLLSVVLSGVAVYYLFPADTKPWFEKEPKD